MQLKVHFILKFIFMSSAEEEEEGNRMDFSTSVSSKTRKLENKDKSITSQRKEPHGIQWSSWWEHKTHSEKNGWNLMSLVLRNNLQLRFFREIHPKNFPLSKLRLQFIRQVWKEVNKKWNNEWMQWTLETASSSISHSSYFTSRKQILSCKINRGLGEDVSWWRWSERRSTTRKADALSPFSPDTLLRQSLSRVHCKLEKSSNFLSLESETESRKKTAQCFLFSFPVCLSSLLPSSWDSNLFPNKVSKLPVKRKTNSRRTNLANTGKKERSLNPGKR